MKGRGGPAQKTEPHSPLLTYSFEDKSWVTVLSLVPSQSKQPPGAEVSLLTADVLALKTPALLSSNTDFAQGA